MDQLVCIGTFIKVAELGSFSRAADSLSVSRALASQHVAALERRLGVRLFERTTRRVRLTHDGSEYLPRALRALAELKEGEAALSRHRVRPQGRLRVEVPVSFGRRLLIPALPEFAKRYPDIVLEVQFNDHIVDLEAERVDVALRFGPVRDERLIARRLGTTRMLTCGAPGYLATAGAPRTLDDLEGHLCIGLTTSQAGKARPWVFSRGRGRFQHRVNCRLAFNNAEAVMAAGLAAGGLFQVVDLLAVQAITSGKLRVVLEDLIAEAAPFSIVYPRDKRTSASVRAFADFAAELMDERYIAKMRG